MCYVGNALLFFFRKVLSNELSTFMMSTKTADLPATLYDHTWQDRLAAFMIWIVSEMLAALLLSVYVRENVSDNH